jgi:hypothetical protein
MRLVLWLIPLKRSVETNVGADNGRYRNHRVSGTQEVKGRGIVHANPEIANDGRIPFDNKGLTISL